MTTVYNDYYYSYDHKLFDINNVAFVAKLVVDKYIPIGSHKPSDVKDYVLVSVGALNGDVMTTKSMGEICNIMQTQILEEIKTNPSDVIELIDQVYADDTEKAQRLKELLLNPFSEDSYMYWQKLRDEGIKYMVVEYPSITI